MNNFLVTGGCGFIGSNLVKKLVEDGNFVYIADNMHTGDLKNLKGIDADKYKLYNSINAFLRENLKVDAIFHLGIASSTPMYRENPHLVGEVVNEFIDILEYLKKNKINMVFASTSSIYNGHELPYKEDLIPYPKDYYTEARYMMERLSKMYSDIYGLKIVALRLFSIYGPNERSKGNYANLVSQFLWAMKKGEQPIIYGDGKQTRDFTYVGDVVEAFLLSEKFNNEGNKGFEVFNVGTGKDYDLNELVDILNEILGTDIKPKYIKNPLVNYVVKTRADTIKAKEILGFEAKTTLREGIKKLGD